MAASRASGLNDSFDSDPSIVRLWEVGRLEGELAKGKASRSIARLALEMRRRRGRNSRSVSCNCKRYKKRRAKIKGGGQGGQRRKGKHAEQRARRWYATNLYHSLSKLSLGLHEHFPALCEAPCGQWAAKSERKRYQSRVNHLDSRQRLKLTERVVGVSDVLEEENLLLFGE